MVCGPSGVAWHLPKRNVNSSAFRTNFLRSVTEKDAVEEKLRDSFKVNLTERLRSVVPPERELWMTNGATSPAAIKMTL